MKNVIEIINPEGKTIAEFHRAGIVTSSMIDRMIATVAAEMDESPARFVADIWRDGEPMGQVFFGGW